MLSGRNTRQPVMDVLAGLPPLLLLAFKAPMEHVSGNAHDHTWIGSASQESSRSDAPLKRPFIYSLVGVRSIPSDGQFPL